MTTEKELTEIKTHVINGDWFGKVFQHEWLKVIEQAERAQELERVIKSHDVNGRNYTNFQVFQISEENIQLRQALEFYADKDTYSVDVESQWAPLIPINRDHGEKARQALAGDPDD